MKNSSFLLLWNLVTFLMTACATRRMVSQNLYRPLRSGVNVEGTILFQFTVRSRLKCPVWYVLLEPRHLPSVKKSWKSTSCGCTKWHFYLTMCFYLNVLDPKWSRIRCIIISDFLVWSPNQTKSRIFTYYVLRDSCGNYSVVNLPHWLKS